MGCALRFGDRRTARSRAIATRPKRKLLSADSVLKAAFVRGRLRPARRQAQACGTQFRYRATSTAGRGVARLAPVCRPRDVASLSGQQLRAWFGPRVQGQSATAEPASGADARGDVGRGAAENRPPAFPSRFHQGHKRPTADIAERPRPRWNAVEVRSGRRDLNPGPRAPKARALPGCATPRRASSIAAAPRTVVQCRVQEPKRVPINQGSKRFLLRDNGNRPQGRGAKPRGSTS